MAFYPPVGFYFKVSIDGFPEAEADFQEVAGLVMMLETLALREGGENRFTHQLPLRTSSDKLVLKRGFKVSSALHDWCSQAIGEFSFSPKDLDIFLLDPALPDSLHNPLVAWHVVHAYPVKWSVSPFNAMNNELVIESVELQYHYFTKSFPA
ncbi:phage tail protein [Dyadobacter sandarakinus]|uniref:Phage tail protein n=1 Tax=Dyadobacter sandarakinus TaxID=2747268 RepID=A0ABX7I4H6_9BACT|nr:phage tail protein [Dyadobacter sandarakinus]QRR00613.1 phage tail protein [Dyadobacter sandarakinus]